MYPILCRAADLEWWIAAVQVDYAVVEVGLGGAKDATNVFDADSLKLAIITSIGLEHQKQLGGPSPHS